MQKSPRASWELIYMIGFWPQCCTKKQTVVLKERFVYWLHQVFVVCGPSLVAEGGVLIAVASLVVNRLEVPGLQ